MEIKRTKESAREEIYAFAEEVSLPFHAIMAGITYPDQTYRIEREKSRFFVFEYVIEGRGHLSIDGHTYKASAGDTYILTPDTKQCYYADKNEPFKKIWVNIESSYLTAVLQAHGLTYGVYHYNSLAPLTKILEIAKNGRSAAAVSAEIAPVILSLIEALSAQYEETVPESPAQLAKKYNEGSGSKEFSPNALAEKLHVSLSTLTRAFQSTYGCTPYEYYLSYKEKMAKSLLQNTGLSAKEIAYRLGFSDEHYFSNFFKKRTGLRPMEYKKGRDFRK